MAALVSDWLRHFWLLLWSRWTEFTKLDRKQYLNVLYQVCVLGWDGSEKQDGRPCLLLTETFSTTSLKQLNGFKRNWTGSMISTSSTKFIPGRSEKQDGRSGLWWAETFLTSPWKALNGIQQNLTGSKIATTSSKLVFFGPIGKTRWPLRLRHFGLMIWKRGSEFNETLQEARSQRPLPDLCFSCQWVYKNGCPCQCVKRWHCTKVHDMWPFGRVIKLLACGARWPGFDSRPRHLNCQRLVISCFQVTKFNLVINALAWYISQCRLVNGQFVISWAVYQIWNWPFTTRHCDLMLKHYYKIKSIFVAYSPIEECSIGIPVNK